MTTFFSRDRAAGELDFHETEQDAIDVANVSLAEYRREADHDGEWMRDVEDVVIGTLANGATPETAEDDDFQITHRATAIETVVDGETFVDYALTPIEAAVAPSST